MNQTAAPSRMAAEVSEIPLALERLLRDGSGSIQAAARAARALSPTVITTVARGSSDQAAGYFKYVAELMLGLPVASIGPSIASIYGAQLQLKNAVCIAVSQSGASPDIVEMARSARQSGALTLAVTNDNQSRLAQTCEATLDIHAGPELSVAATKTFVTSVVVLLGLIAEWRDDAQLKAALHRLPEQLARAAEMDWAGLRMALAGAGSLYTLGRGPAFAISGEAALKFKEISQIHAENYSSAEVLHGPVSIVGKGFPVLVFAARDAAETGVAEIADQLAAKGAQVLITSDKVKIAQRLPFVETGHPMTDPLALIVTFYATVERFAREAGIDPDNPRHLRKITHTI